jgi:hypothetical protein
VNGVSEAATERVFLGSVRPHTRDGGRPGVFGFLKALFAGPQLLMMDPGKQHRRRGGGGSSKRVKISGSN